MSGERGILIVPEYSYCPASGSQSGIVLAPVFDSVSRGTEFATGSEKDLITSLKKLLSECFAYRNYNRFLKPSNLSKITF
jgi:hypothetical protein